MKFLVWGPPCEVCGEVLAGVAETNWGDLCPNCLEYAFGPDWAEKTENNAGERS